MGDAPFKIHPRILGVGVQILLLPGTTIQNVCTIREWFKQEFLLSFLIGQYGRILEVFFVGFTREKFS